MKIPFNLLTLLTLTISTLASTLETISTPTKSGSSYLIRAYDGTALQLAGDVFRIPISKNSSNGDFTFLATSGEGAAQRVTPHHHLKAYETFYCQKGALNIWANGESRRLGPGDFAVVPHHVNHSYQLLEPDTLLAGVIQPGGFEDFFVNISSPYNATISTPFPAGQALDFPISAFSSASSDPKYDVYVQPNAILPSNMINGTSSNTTPWHTGNNTLPLDSTTPYFIANNWGPKFLHSNSGSVIAPLVTKETSNGNWTLSTMTFQKNGLKDKKWNFETSQAIYVLEGSLKVKVGNQSESEILISGDLIYLTPGDTFELYGDRNWAKALILGAGIEGLSNELLKESIDWAHAVGPAHKLK